MGEGHRAYYHKPLKHWLIIFFCAQTKALLNLSIFLFLFFTFLFSCVRMEFNTAFFHYILPKICNTSILLTSLLIYSEKKKHHATGLLLLVGTVCGLFIQALLTCFHASLATHLTLYQSHIQLVFSSLLFLCTTVLGFDMVKTLEQQKKSTSSFIIHLATMSTPTMFILNQGMDVNLYLIKHSVSFSLFLFSFFFIINFIGRD